MDKEGILKGKNDLIKGMYDYLTEYGGEGYSKKDVKKVDKELEEYFASIEKASKKSRADYLSIVKKTVIKLNKLNEKSEGSMIETDQREEICSFMINSAILFNFIDSFQDITEEWREW